MKITSEIIEAFSGTFLSPRYDAPQPTPPLHRELWELYCTDDMQVCAAAPRNHAKSTALTHDFILANVMFRVEDYVVLIGSSEDMAVEHLNDISSELHENEDLVREFGISDFVTDQKTDVICRLADGHQFRIIARGAEQKIRGRKWKGKRPGLIVCDDMEDDEQVENRDRRVKFRKWFQRAAKQALRDGGRIRVHGTILHEDSLLNRILQDKTWTGKLYRAHQGFDDFSNILWPEKFPEARLRYIRETFIGQGDPAGYSQEYLNDPFDNSDQYLRKDDFLPMTEDDYDDDKRIYMAIDFAVSQQQAADRTSITVGGKGLDNVLCIVDERVGRWASDQIVEELFLANKAWAPEAIFVEDGVIWQTLRPTIYREMQLRDEWLNLVPHRPSKDKATRGRPFQKRHRGRGMRFDKTAEWYPAYEYELLRFTGTGQAVHDDQFDSTSLLVFGMEHTAELAQEDYEEVPEGDDGGFWNRGKQNGASKPGAGGY